MGYDRVIDAVIDRKDHFLFSKEAVNLYTTPEPADAFHKRIQFCMGIHNESVKAMRYLPNAHKPESEKEKEGKEKEEREKEEKKKEGKDKDKGSDDTGTKKKNRKRYSSHHNHHNHRHQFITAIFSDW